MNINSSNLELLQQQRKCFISSLNCIVVYSNKQHCTKQHIYSLSPLLDVNSMDIPTSSNPSFFKILLDDASPNLPLPLTFVKKQFSKDGFPEYPVLETEFGGKWKVEIDKIGDKFCFVNGWLDFVRDSKSEVGDFLVFRLIGKSTFKVTIFGPNACAKDLSFVTPIHCKYGCNCNGSGISYGDLKNVIKTEEDCDDLEDEIKIEVEDMDEDDNDLKEIKIQPFDWKEEFKVQRLDWNEECPNPSFIKVLTKSHNYEMRLPKRFVKETGLDRKEKIVVRNKEMKKWSVRIGRWADGRHYLGYGWLHFLKQNKLMDGDTCSFKYSHGEEDGTSSLIEFEILHKVAGERERFSRNR